MAKPLNWVLFDPPETKAVSRSMGKRLALTTILAVAPFLNYGRPTYANCIASPSPTFICSGASAEQNINVNNADVSTVAGFSVNTAVDNGITITGDGHLSYTDTNASPVTSTNDDGLYVRSTGDDGATDGAVTINTNGNITGGFRGIYARNDGSGDIAITADGQIEGQGAVHGDGIYALNYGNNLTITTGVGSSVTGADEGIDAVNQGGGDLVINANGDVDGANDGIAAYNSVNGVNLTVTIGSQSAVTAGGTGIYADNQGSGALGVTVNGSVGGSSGDGLYARNYGTNLTIITAAGSSVTGGDEGIDAVNQGTGDLNVTADGYVNGANDGILAYNSSNGGDLTVTTGAQSAVYAGHNGIDARNYGSGDLNVTANGYVSGGNDGILAYNSSNGGNLTVTTGTQSAITGNDGDGIYAYNHGSGNLSITADGEVTGIDSGEFTNPSDGIYAVNLGGDLIITTGAGSIITGDDNAIDARNYGSGDLDITVNGQANSSDYDGIFARNYGNDLNVTIGADASVDGAGSGIQAQNRSEGNLDITVDGDVTGRGFDGIRAYNYGANLSVTTGAQSVILGHDNGIDARNYSEDSDGDLTVIADGIVTGYYNDGIFARNFGNDLTITTGGDSIVRGGGNGIGAYNFGSGNLTVTADGLVGGYSEDGDGIHAFNSEDGGDLTIITGADSDVFGGKDGIDAQNIGSGFLKITAEGQVTGYDGDGIKAFNSVNGSSNEDGEALSITTGAGSVVYGSDNGINALNNAEGDLTITANGEVTGEYGIGIYARNNSGPVSDPYFGLANASGDDLTITTGAASVVTGRRFGIVAINHGFGDLFITANGQVTGENEDGIYGMEGDEGGDLTVVTGASSIVTGHDDGIGVRSLGDGKIDITLNGEVTGTYGSGLRSFNAADGDTYIKVGATGLLQGNESAINAVSYGQDINITNDGLVRNLSAESSDLAITTQGGVTHIDNNGNLIGEVLLDPDDHYDDVLNNAGFWNAANGTSDLGLGEDVVNNTGTLRAADDPTVLEETNIGGVETFNNDGGLISLLDGQAGDMLFLYGDGVPGALSYQGTNGHLAVDAELGPAGFADELTIDGDTSGTTLVHVNVVNVTGANLVGIPVVVVTNGTTVEDNFNLDGPLNAGFFTWDMRLDGNTHELFTSGIGVGAFEFAAGITGAQDLWYQSIGTLLQRQADLRALLEGTQVTPVADFAEPVEPTPVAHVTPGFWFKGIGAWLERDDEEDGFNLDRKQTIWGGLAGFDVGTESAGSVWMFGLFGGYLSSELKFDETNSEWDYEGPSVGAYATYMDSAFYANATVKADFLDIDIDPEDLGGDDADTDAVNIGGMIDTGYKIGGEVYIEPQASLAAVETEIDDVDVFGGTVEFDDETSIRGRLGLRLGFDHAGDNEVVYSSDVTASVWEDFSGDNDVSITDPTFGSFGASDDAGGTYGDVSLGFSATAPEGWSSFIRGNYQFGEDFEAFAGNAGVRYAF